MSKTNDPNNASLSALDDAEIERLRATCQDDVTVDLSAAYKGLQERIEREERSPLAPLRASSTRRRLLLAAVLLGLPVVLASALGLRSDIATYPALHMGVVLAAMLLLMGVSLWIALRPLHVAPLPSATNAWVLGGGVLALFGLYLWPALPAAGPMHLTHVLSHALPCLLTGLAIGLPLYLLLRLLDRGDAPHAALLALSAGICANAVLQLRCPAGDAPHLVLGHLGVVALMLSIYAALTLRARSQAD